MAKNFKVLRFSERVVDPESLVLCEDAHKVYEKSTVLREVEVEEDGEYVKITKKVTVDPKEDFAIYKPSDFKLSNVIKAGALDTLKYGTIAGSNIDSVLEGMEAQITE